MRYEAKWLPGGSIDLAELPLAGSREVRQAEFREANIISLLHNSRRLTLEKAIMAACKMLPSQGAAKTKASWDAHVWENFAADAPMFIWGEADFEESLKAARQRYVYLRHEVATDEAAIEAISKAAKELDAKGEEIRKEAQAKKGPAPDIPLLALYWRLRNSGLKKILLPTGEKALDWDLAKKDEAMAIIGEVATESDYERMFRAPAKGGDKRAPSPEDLDPLSRADVEGKSSPTLQASTASSPSSTPSSAFPTATTAPPLPSAAPSG